MAELGSEYEKRIAELDAALEQARRNLAAAEEEHRERMRKANWAGEQLHRRADAAEAKVAELQERVKRLEPHLDSDEKDGLPGVAGDECLRTPEEIIYHARVAILEQQTAAAHDPAMIGLLCDTVRLAREFAALEQEVDKSFDRGCDKGYERAQERIAELEQAVDHWTRRAEEEHGLRKAAERDRDKTVEAARDELIAYSTWAMGLRRLLMEWRSTPYFEIEGDWVRWVDTFGARVDAAVKIPRAPALVRDDVRRAAAVLGFVLVEQIEDGALADLCPECEGAGSVNVERGGTSIDCPKCGGTGLDLEKIR